MKNLRNLLKEESRQTAVHKKREVKVESSFKNMTKEECKEYFHKKYNYINLRD
ncbi:hypothetical protein HOS99_gp101 [Staphylococcus phage phiSA_BS1]|uniref:Uncharacterized protein n=1 Tax=Staphylococcus phage phiSA_BS1 TaxID=2126734 RepID=A0A2P1MXR1_9CAUD|nr:hypothetical protein HOS99_gp101 [Staphylococcus phage phiSA_BS1]AVP40346.1 hypothetical protein [Staphylococcus phage phiSA_BS1]